jgi:hypothetical protein
MPVSGRHLFLVGVNRGCSLAFRLPGSRARNNRVFPVRRAGVSCRGRNDIRRYRFEFVEKQFSYLTPKANRKKPEEF